MDNNAYFEQVKSFYAQKTDDEIAASLARLQVINDKLKDDEVWKVFLLDITERMKSVDFVWQDTYNKEQLENLRVLKKAFLFVKSLPERYATDLQFVKKEISLRENKSTIIEKDYDDE